MKKTLLFVSLLLIAAAYGSCTNIPTNTSNTNANAPLTSKTATGVSQDEIVAKEKAGWDAIKKKDWDALGKLLTSDFIDVEDDGVFDKAGSIASLKNYDLSDVTFSNWKMLTIDKDAVILTYDLSPKATSNGQAVPPGPYHAAAAYVNRDGQWLGISFQQTLAKAMEMGPSPSPSQPKKPAASPAKMADAGSDPIANEKLVWDALRAKNYDAFAGYLAADSINIEPDGVFDKAGSVKGVSTFDASKYELSDWKTVKFDDDSSLVTYTVTSGGATPEKERHTSIWAKRDGKWLAVFHQGTPAAKPEAKK